MREIKERPYQLDLLGNKVVAGQTVITNRVGSSYLSIGVVKNITDKGIVARYEDGKTKKCACGQFVLVTMKDNKNIYR